MKYKQKELNKLTKEELIKVIEFLGYAMVVGWNVPKNQWRKNLVASIEDVRIDSYRERENKSK